jgi:hypothetical protein
MIDILLGQLRVGSRVTRIPRDEVAREQLRSLVLAITRYSRH